MHNESPPPPVAAPVRVEDELRQVVYRYTDTDAPMLGIATRALLEIERLRNVIALKNGIIDQYVPCADHRDKHDGTCSMCAAERGRADTTRLDWLEENAGNAVVISGTRQEYFYIGAETAFTTEKHRTLRAAIDAAMSPPAAAVAP